MDSMLIFRHETSSIVEDRKFLVGAKSSVSARQVLSESRGCFSDATRFHTHRRRKPDEEVVDPFVCRFVCRRAEFVELRSTDLGTGSRSRRGCCYGRRRSSFGLLSALRLRSVPPDFPWRLLRVQLRQPVLQSLSGTLPDVMPGTVSLGVSAFFRVFASGRCAAV